MHLDPHKMTRAQKMQFLSAVQTGKIDIKSLEQLATYFILPSTVTPGNWLVITDNDTVELTPAQYEKFNQKIDGNEKQ